MSTIKVEGNGNFVFQSHSGSGDNISGNKITINTVDNKTQIQNAIARGDIDGALRILETFSNDAAQIWARWNGLKQEKMLGVISFENEKLESAKIINAIMGAAGCSVLAMTNSTPTPQSNQSWEAELLQIIKDNERKSPATAKEASKLLEAFRSYHDTKNTHTFFDVSGRKLQEIKEEFEAFKKDLHGSEMDSKESFIERVSDLLSARVPDWPSIAEAYKLCVGRGFTSSWMKTTLEEQPNDDEAKLNCVQMIEGFLSRV